MTQDSKRTRSNRLAFLGGAVTALMIATSSLSAQATTQTSNQKLSFNNQSVVVPGEGTFTVSGGAHVLLHSTLDASGGCHVTGHVNPQGLSVKGPDGTTYRAAGAANFTLQSTSGASGTQFHGVANVNLIGKGQTPDRRFHFNVKTAPAMAPGTCDARRIAQLVIDELGITAPASPGT